MKKSKICYRLLSMVLCIGILLSVLSVVAVAETTLPTELIVGTETVIMNSQVLGNTTGDGWSYDVATGTLTLTDAQIHGQTVDNIESIFRGTAVGIACQGDLTLVLSGRNDVTSGDNETSSVGINVRGNLTITSQNNGELYVTSGSAGDNGNSTCIIAAYGLTVGGNASVWNYTGYGGQVALGIISQGTVKIESEASLFAAGNSDGAFFGAGISATALSVEGELNATAVIYDAELNDERLEVYGNASLLDTAKLNHLYIAPEARLNILANGVLDMTGMTADTVDCQGTVINGGTILCNHTGDPCDICGKLTVTEPVSYSIIYFQNNWLWSELRAYYWGGAHGSADWPGNAMDFVEKKGDYDIYSITIPSDSTGLVFSGLKDDGSGVREQCADITDIQTDVYYSLLWNDGIFTTTTPYIPFECDHSYDEGVVTAPTCTEGGYTTYTCTLCGDEITDNATDATGHSYGDDGKCEACGQEKSITLYLRNDDNWAQPHAYMWSDDNTEMTLWPGIAMTQVEGDIYSVQVPADAVYIIFNGGVGGTQTANLTIPTDGSNLYSFSDNDWGTYGSSSETDALVVNMYDINEDGWDGAELLLYVNGELCDSLTMDEGASLSRTFDYDSTAVYTFVWVSGSYPEECSFEIFMDGELVFEALDGSKLADDSVVYTTCTHEGTLTAEVTPPTCTENGYTTTTCSACGYEAIIDEVPYTNHSFAENGICATCGAGKSIRVDMEDTCGDGWDDAFITVYRDGTELATLTVEEGTASWSASYDENCLYTFVWNGGQYDAECTIRVYINGIWEYETDDASCLVDGCVFYVNCDHTYDEGVIVEPTCIESGYTMYTCTKCSCVKSEDFVPTTGHTAEEGTQVVTDPTCNDYGYTTYICAVCGETYEGNWMDPTGHSFDENGDCVCGENNRTTIYFEHTDWIAPYAYVWNDENQNMVKWPGIAMTLVSGTLYKVEVPQSFQYIIFNDCGQGGTGAQTDDLTIPTDGNNLYTGRTDSWSVRKAIDLLYPTLSFYAQIEYNIFFTLEGVEVSWDKLGLAMFDSMLTDGTIEDAITTYSQISQGEAEYMVSTDGIPAKNMGDTIYFKVYAQLEDGSYLYSDIQSYSAVEYAKSILHGDSNEDLKAMMAALMNYGALAQEYFNYNTENLMNSWMTEEQKALGSNYDPAILDPVGSVTTEQCGDFAPTGTGFARKYPAVAFGGAFVINYFFELSQVPEGDVTFYAWGGASEVFTQEDAFSIVLTADAQGQYTARIGVSAANLDNTQYVAVVYTDVNGVTHCTGVLPYSIEAYASAMQGTFMDALAKATLAYGALAKVYLRGE